MIYLKDGNIPLNLAYGDEIVQEANGTYQLSFKYPVAGNHWQALKNETFLLADDLHGEQEFFIFEVKRTHGYIQVYANQVMSLLNGYAMTSISVDRVAGQTVMTALAGSIIRQHPFSFMSDIMGRHTLNVSDKSVMEALVKDKHSILGQWGGDLVREKYAVRLLQNGGSENESLFMYKKNMSSFEQAANIKSLRTRIHFKKTIEGEEGQADQVLAVTVDSPLIDKYSQIYESHQKVEDQDVTDLESLEVYAKNYYAQTLCDVAEDSIEIAVKGQSDTPVRLFDVVSVYHERYDVDLRLKISKYSYSPMRKKLKSIGFGKVGQSVGSHMSGLVNEAVSAATAGLEDDFDRKLQKEIDNANRAFDAEFEKRKTEIEDSIEQTKAEAEKFAGEIADKVAAVESQISDMEKQIAESDANSEKLIAEFEKQLEEFKSLDTDELAKEIEKLKNEISISDEQINEALAKAGFDKSTLDDLKKMATTNSDTLETVVDMIGSDGRTTYSRNRATVTEGLIPLGTESLSVGHNGDGFEVGESYVISWEALCNPYPSSEVVLSFDTPRMFGVTAKLVPSNPLYPTNTADVTETSKTIYAVYHDTYTLTVEGDWYQDVTLDGQVVNGPKTITVPLAFKTVADGNLTDKYIGEWAETPEIILDGGS